MPACNRDLEREKKKKKTDGQKAVHGSERFHLMMCLRSCSFFNRFETLFETTASNFGVLSINMEAVIT